MSERPGGVGGRFGLRTANHVALGRLCLNSKAGAEACLPRAADAPQEDGTERHPRSPNPKLLVLISELAVHCEELGCVRQRLEAGAAVSQRLRVAGPRAACHHS